MNNIISPEARKAIAVGEKRHWKFRVVGLGEIPDSPAYKDQWWFLPNAEPMHGKDRLEALKRAGVKMKGIVVAHEAPRLLPAPEAVSNAPTENGADLDRSIPATDSLGTLAEGLAMGLILLVGVAFQAMAAVDPALIAVLEDGTWLEVCTWYE